MWFLYLCFVCFGSLQFCVVQEKIPALFILNSHRLQFSSHFTNTHICVRTNKRKNLSILGLPEVFWVKAVDESELGIRTQTKNENRKRINDKEDTRSSSPILSESLSVVRDVDFIKIYFVLTLF